MPKKHDRIKYDQIILYAVMVILIAALMWSVFGLTQKNYFGSDYNKAIQSQNKENICATPEGYTDQEWIEHMGHHPDQYKECLDKLK
ncbi:MAG: hypothetical protein Q7J54_04150 [Candidatus Woesearchaeota archaeon]|nr:hypothetical protein [Candidatus Woesearchaeota archaeon]